MHENFMRQAVELALENIKNNNGGPFGAIITKNNQIVGSGVNLVTSTCDPTAHAEICAIRNTCKNLKNFHLQDCEIYTSSEPCPMCLSAIYWARIKKIYFGTNQSDITKILFDDENFYQEIKKPPQERKIPMIQLMRNHCLELFNTWEQKSNKIYY